MGRRQGKDFEELLEATPLDPGLVRGKGVVSISKRAAMGAYYTPPEITAYLVARALSTLSSSGAERRRLRAIDPACGAGAFLSELGQQLSRSSAKGGLHRLVGWDVLEDSLEIARSELEAQRLRHSVDFELQVVDALRSTDDDRARFDLVISNPPWGASLPGWTDEEARERYPECGSEKDSYAMFIIRAHQLLRDGGILAYVVPNSWLTVRGYEGLRRWFLDSFQLVEVANIWRIFRGVNHDVSLVIARKEAREKGRVKSTVRNLTRRSSMSDKLKRLSCHEWDDEFKVDPEKWRQEKYSRFEVMYDQELSREIDDVSKKCIPLGDCANVTVGIQVYHRRKVERHVIENREFHSHVRVDSDWFPYIEKNQVQRYFEVPQPRRFLHFNERLCDKRGLAHYARPRILIQQIFWGRLAASLSRPKEPMLYLNTLFSVSSSNDDISLEYLLALLNSRTISACYERWTNRLLGEKFPKVSKRDLARLPVPIMAQEEMARIAEYGDRLTGLWSALKREIGSPPAPELWEEIEEVEGELEDAIRAAYGMSQSLHDQLIQRAPPVQMNDALLPK